MGARGNSILSVCKHACIPLFVCFRAPEDLRRSRRFRAPNTAGLLHGGGTGNTGDAAQSGLLFRIENFFCLGSPLSVFLTLR